MTMAAPTWVQISGIWPQISQPKKTAKGRRRYSNGATADISPALKACTQKYCPIVAEAETPTASTQPHAVGQRHTQIAGTTSNKVDQIANWVRIISGVSESLSRFTSRMESA